MRDKKNVFDFIVAFILMIVSIMMFYHARGYLSKYIVASSFEIAVASLVFLFSLHLIKKTLRV